METPRIKHWRSFGAAEWRHVKEGALGLALGSLRLSLGKGVSALFAGPSGTGKTTAADIVARELGLDMYKVDLSGVAALAFTSANGRTQTSLSEINITPLVDVVLVLLIIFMVTAPVLQSGIEVAVPKTRTVKEITEERLVISIDST